MDMILFAYRLPPPRFPHYPAICSQTPFKASDNPHVFIDVFKTKRICFFFQI